MGDKTIYEIRVCENCGLRYPRVSGQAHGTRCPICMGDTRVVLSKRLSFESDPTGPSGSSGTFSVLLDNIRSAWNVGSILRSADGFGFKHAYLCGITPTPENEAVQKTSLGAEDSVTWSYHKDAVKLIKGLKREGRYIIGLEESARSVDLHGREVDSGGTRMASVLIAGNEITGIDPDLLASCDEIVAIPMRGGKKSLNVAVAFSVAAYVLTAAQ